MNNRMKFISFVILSTNMFLFLNAPLVFGIEKYNWPPKDGEQLITLVGPIYETGSETNAPLFKALEKAMTAIVKNQKLFLPEFYQEHISGMKHQLFRPGYSNDEEWVSIKSLSSKAKDYDPERRTLLSCKAGKKPVAKGEFQNA